MSHKNISLDDFDCRLTPKFEFCIDLLKFKSHRTWDSAGRLAADTQLLPCEMKGKGIKIRALSQSTLTAMGGGGFMKYQSKAVNEGEGGGLGGGSQKRPKICERPLNRIIVANLKLLKINQNVFVTRSYNWIYSRDISIIYKVFLLWAIKNWADFSFSERSIWFLALKIDSKYWKYPFF